MLQKYVHSGCHRVDPSLFPSSGHLEFVSEAGCICASFLLVLRDSACGVHKLMLFFHDNVRMTVLHGNLKSLPFIGAGRPLALGRCSG